jgi:hypothetical protein
MPAFKYVARYNGEIIGKRTSAAKRVYTHAIVALNTYPQVVAWSGSLRLAQDEARRRGGLEIVPAERVDAHRPEVTIDQKG